MSAGAVLLALWGLAHAADEPKEGMENWDGQFEISASSATGNTENTVLGVRLKGRRILGRFTHDVDSGADYTETTKDTNGVESTEITQNRWYAAYRAEIHTGDRTFFYVRTRYEEDPISGFDRRAFLGGGLGHDVIENKQVTWSVLAGPGYQFTQLVRPETPAASFEREEKEVAVFVGSDFKWQIRDNVDFENEVDMTWTEKNSTFDGQLALTTELTKAIATRITYKLRHETEPAEGKEATDTQLKASVVLSY